MYILGVLSSSIYAMIAVKLVRLHKGTSNGIVVSHPGSGYHSLVPRPHTPMRKRV